MCVYFAPEPSASLSFYMQPAADPPSRRSRFIDEEGELAHEFYEETEDGTLVRQYHNIRPEVLDVVHIMALVNNGCRVLLS